MSAITWAGADLGVETAVLVSAASVATVPLVEAVVSAVVSVTLVHKSEVLVV